MRPRALLVLRRSLEGLGLVLVFVSALLAAILIHLSLPGPRRVAADFTGRILTDQFKGSAHIDAIDKLGPGGLVARGLHMRDAQGTEIISVRTLEARFSAWSILRRIVTSGAKFDVSIDHVRLDDATVLVVPGPDGTPTIAQAFEPRRETAKAAEGESQSRVRVWLPTIELGKLSARVKLGKAPMLDGSVREARASLLVAPAGVAIDVERFGTVVRGLAGMDVEGIGSFHLRSRGPMWAYFDGDVGQIPAHVFARIDGKKLEARADLPRVDPAAARAILPAWPVRSPIGVTARAAGLLPHLEAELTAGVGTGSVHAKGPLSLADGISVDLDIESDELDLNAIDPALPTTNLSARSALLLWTDGETLTAEANAALEPSIVADVEVPAIDLRADYGARGLEARATFHELGVPARLFVRMPPSGELVLEGELKRTRIENSPRFSKLFGATGTVEADVDATLKDGHLVGRVELETSNLRRGGIAIGSAKVSASAEGPSKTPENLRVNATLDVRQAQLGPLPLERLKGTITGAASSPAVKLSGTQEDGTALEAAGKVGMSPWSLSDASFAVSRRGSEISGSLREGKVHEDHIDVTGLVVESGGKLTLDAEISRRRAKIVAHGDDIDLSRIARALSLPATHLSGQVGIDANVTLGDTSQGKAHVKLDKASLWTLTGVSLDATTTFDGKLARGEMTGGVDELGRLTAAWNAELAGNALSADSWLDATGQSQIAAEQLNLGLLARMFGKELGIESAGGTGYARFSLARTKSNELPHALFLAGTERLGLTVPQDGKEPLDINAVDFSVAGALNGSTRKVELSGRVFDFRGDLVTVSAEMPAQLNEVVRAIKHGEKLAHTFKDQEFRAVALVPDRAIEQLPAFLRPSDVSGHVSGRAVLAGTFFEPEVSLAVSTRNLVGSATALALPIGLDASVRYAKKTGKLDGSVQARQGRQRIAWGTFDLLVPFEHLRTPPKPETPYWTGKGQLLLDGAPLEVLEALAVRGVEGTIQGSVGISRTKWMPELRTDLTLRHLIVSDTEIGEGRIVAESTDKDIVARARFEDEFGTLTSSIQTRLVATPMLMTIEENSPVYVTLESSRYDAVVLSPFVRSLMPELSGALDGSLRATLSPPPPKAARKAPRKEGEPEPEAEPWNATFEGNIRLSNGVMAPAGLGLRLLDTNISIVAKREGEFNVVHLNDIEGRAESEKPNVHGSGTLYFSNLELVKGNFQVEPDDVPLSPGGTHLANMTGNIEADLALKDKALVVTVNVPRMKVELPERSDHKVIDIADNPNITILQPLGPPSEEETTSESKAPTTIDLKLGDEVFVSSRLMNLQLKGEPQIVLADETRMSGSIELVPGGRIQVMGRVFFIEQGRVQFDTEEPSNPHLDVTATWRAPNGVLVRAIVRGTAAKPELGWDSDPALPGGEQAIIGLVLGTGGDSSGSGTGAGVAGGAAIVNELLGRTGVPIEFYASRDTGDQSAGQVASLSERVWDSYTAAYRVSDEIWFEGSFRQESTTLETESRSGFSGALDWRFRKDWSLRTEVGTLGGGVDLLWQYSY